MINALSKGYGDGPGDAHGDGCGDGALSDHGTHRGNGNGQNARYSHNYLYGMRSYGVRLTGTGYGTGYGSTRLLLQPCTSFDCAVLNILVRATS